MVLAQQRIIGRSEESFAASGCYAAHEHQHHHPVGKSRKHCRYAPEEYAQGRDPLAAEAVASPAPQRNHQCVEKVEYSRNEAHRGIGKIQ